MEGEPDLLNAVVAVFLETTPAALVTLARAAVTNDLGDLQNAAHDLKSSGATLGAHQFSLRCARLEAMARAGLASDTRALVGEIAAEFAALRPLLANLVRERERSMQLADAR